MRLLVGLLGAALIALMLAEFFVTFLLPRRVKRDPRIARRVFPLAWRPWRLVASRLPPVAADTLLGLFGPLGLISILLVWTLGLIVGFGAVHWANDSQLGLPASPSFWDDLYFSAGAFFSASTGLAPRGGIAHLLNILEAASGFGVFFIVIGYLPSLYQAFSRREVAVSQLDPRAGSPPTAGALLENSARDGGWAALDAYLGGWEEWAAELMETHLSYPVLGYFRSQHVNQSWLAGLTTVLDASAVAISCAPRSEAAAARRAFAIGRHALADLTLVFRAEPCPPALERLTPEQFGHLGERLRTLGLQIAHDREALATLRERRAMYEPYAAALADTFALTLPQWIAAEESQPNWRMATGQSDAGPGWHSP